MKKSSKTYLNLTICILVALMIFCGCTPASSATPTGDTNINSAVSDNGDANTNSAVSGAEGTDTGSVSASIDGTNDKNISGNIRGTYTQIKADEVFRIMEEETGYVILDVRTQAEYDEGHIPDAICVPNETIQAINIKKSAGSDSTEADKTAGNSLSESGKEILIPELPDKHQKILIYCRSGNRSKQAAQKLVDLGYTQVYEFGGIKDWPGEIVR